MASEGIQRRIDSLLDEADAAVSKYEWEAVREAAQAVPLGTQGRHPQLSRALCRGRGPV